MKWSIGGVSPSDAFRKEMDDMKKSLWICLVACAAWLGATCVQAATYYINDSSREADEWCSATGNSANTGLLPSSPKDSWASLTNAVALVAGDVIYFDTGMYEGETRIACEGREDSRIRIVGSPKGAVFKNTTSGEQPFA